MAELYQYDECSDHLADAEACLDDACNNTEGMSYEGEIDSQINKARSAISRALALVDRSKDYDMEEDDDLD